MARPPELRQEHLKHVEQVLLIHGGPAVDVTDVRRKLAYYDALLCRPVLDRVLPQETFAAFDAFWIAGEYEKAYEFITSYPTVEIDKEQIAFANTIWNLLDKERWRAVEKMEANGDRVKRFFGSGVKPLPETWHQRVTFQQHSSSDHYLQFRLAPSVDSLVTGLRASIYPITNDAIRKALMDATVQISNQSTCRMEGSLLLLDLLDHMRPLWIECAVHTELQIRVSQNSSPSSADALRDARLVVFLDGWRGDKERQARR